MVSVVSEALLESVCRQYATGALAHGTVVRIAVEGRWPDLCLGTTCAVSVALHPGVVGALTEAGFRGDSRRLRTRSAAAVRALAEAVAPDALWPAAVPLDRRLGPARRAEAFRPPARVQGRGAVRALDRALDALADRVAEGGRHDVQFGFVMVRRRGNQVIVEPQCFDLRLHGRRLRLSAEPTHVSIHDAVALVDAARAGGAVCVEAGAGRQLVEALQWRGRLITVDAGAGLDEVHVRVLDDHSCRVDSEPERGDDIDGEEEAAMGRGAAVAQVGDVQRDRVQTGPSTLAALVDAVPAWRDGGLELVVDPDVADLADMSVAVSVGRVGLYPHQDRFCSVYAATGSGVVCAMAPGAGKTAAACVALAERCARATGTWRGLVVAPAGVLAQWRAELERWGPARTADSLDDWIAHGGVLLAGARDGAAVYERLAVSGASLDDLVIDEASGLHRSSDRSASYWNLRGRARRAMALTGTPNGRGWLEVVALCEFARGRRGGYRRIDAQLRRRGAAAAGPALFVDTTPSGPISWSRPATLDVLHLDGDDEVAAIEDHLFDTHRRLVEAAAQANALGALHPEGRPVYQSLRSTRLEVLNGARSLVAAWAWVGVEAVVAHVRSVEEPTLLFCDDRRTLDSVVAGLGGTTGVLDGRTPPASRDQIARAFQSGDIDRLCISRAGSVGLNLQRARRVVFADLPFSPALLRQRIGRAVRAGSDGSAVTVVAVAVGDTGRRAVTLLARRAVDQVALYDDVADGSSELGIIAELCAARRRAVGQGD